MKLFQTGGLVAGGLVGVVGRGTDGEPNADGAGAVGGNMVMWVPGVVVEIRAVLIAALVACVVKDGNGKRTKWGWKIVVSQTF